MFCFCSKHTTKLGGLFKCQAHTKVGFFVCVSSTHESRVFLFVYQAHTKVGGLFVNQAHTKVGVLFMYQKYTG